MKQVQSMPPIIVVTGAAGALGGAVCRHLAREGKQVIGVDLADHAPDLSGRFIGGVDLTDPGSVAAAAKQITDGAAVRGLANIAGGFTWETIADGSVESWDRLYRMNVLTAFNMSRALLPALARTGGAIVNVGAAATLKAVTGMGAYTASKSGVARFTEALADEVKDKGVRVNAVLPSIIDTPANRSALGEDDVDKWVTPSELAAVIDFLLSDRASGVTGAAIPVSGRI
jgi:NAD(P)-dependent dehydrogenase (short-subunit alcohol dehydrogenase family)